jgi:hypothetical protein
LVADISAPLSPRIHRRSSAMRIPYRFGELVLAAFLLSRFGGAAAQQSSLQQDLPTLSPAVHAALYPEVMSVHCSVPQWDHGPVGGGIMTGSIQGFIAKTDLTGRTIQSLRTGRFSPHQVCEASDGTVWTLGYALDYRDSPDADKNLLRHYSFEKGLLVQFSSHPLPSTSKWMPPMENSRAGMSPFLQSLAKERLDLQ